MQIFNVPLRNTHKFRFQSAWLSLVCHKAFAGRIIVEFWALAWAQVVIFMALTSHVADSHPPPHPQFCFAKGCFAARQWWTKALVGARLSFFEEDLKAKLCRPLPELE
jgi:hypothetical protein